MGRGAKSPGRTLAIAALAARDMATFGRALQDYFPRSFSYFET
jgi:hypothetical protein